MTGVAGDTFVFTATGMHRLAEVWSTRKAPALLAGVAGGNDAFAACGGVVRFGRCTVARVGTREGFAMRAAPEQGLFSEERGWVRLAELRTGEAVRVAGHGGAFGDGGSAAEGHVLGWLVASGHLTRDRAVLRFDAAARDSLALLLAAEVNAVIRPGRSRPHVAVGLVEVRGGGAVTIASSRLREFALDAGLEGPFPGVPRAVWRGSRALQNAFLQALFEARADVYPAGPRAGVHLVTPGHAHLLTDVQRLLLNFGLYSRVAPGPAHRRGADTAPRTPARRSGGGPASRGARPRTGAAAPRCAGPPRVRHSPRLTLTGASARGFPEVVGFLGEAKQRALGDFARSFSRRPYRERFVAHVDTVAADGADWVYGVRGAAAANFVANGFVTAAPAGAEGAEPREPAAGLRAGG